MRHVERPPATPEALLDKGAKEQDDAEKIIEKHLKAVAAAKKAKRKPPKKPSIPFKTYRDKAVKTLLVEAFDGKCAYCESFYSSTQPMDVEHYRPKGAVDGEPDHPGYYWLAATWTNLLPSCIDCNRKRSQFDVVDEAHRQLGKMDRFPVRGTRARRRADELHDEDALLVDPTIDDPDDIFRFDRELGVIVPRFKSGKRHDRAVKSIEVYGLNRSGLVTDRRHIIRQIDHHLEVIRLLTTVRDGLPPGGTPDLRAIVIEVIDLELGALFSMADRDRPYAGMARQLLDELASDLSPSKP